MLGFLIAIILALLLTVVLPLVALGRAAAARDAMARLERRIAALEDQLRHDHPAPRPSDETSIPAASDDLGASKHLTAAPTTVATSMAQGAPSSPPRESTAIRLEARIGTRWMLYVGVAALVIGVGLFIRYAFASQWVTPPLRVAFGGLAGALVFVAGRRAVTAGHARFGTTLIGGAIAIWYLAVYAALNLYGLLNAVMGFGLLVSITGLAAAQADRLRSQPLATVAVVGGFGTPFLVGVNTGSHLSLFCYTTLLLGAIVYLAHRRDWPSLNLTSFLLTGLTVPIWNVRLYLPDAYLTTELFFTIYAALFLWVLHRMRRSSHPQARWVRLALWTTPAWYHLASLSVLTPHRLAFLVYLIIGTGVGVVLSVRRESMWTRLLLWVAVAVPLFDWAGSRPDQSWLVPAAVTWLAVAGIHVAAQVELIRRVRARIQAADVLLIPAVGLGLFVGLDAVLAPSRYALTGFVAAALAAAYAAVTVAVRRLDPRAARHTLSVAVTLAVVAGAVFLDGAWTPILLATQAAGLVWIGLREDRAWLRSVGALLLAIAITRLLAVQFDPVPAAYTVILNRRALLGFFVVAMLGYVAWLHARTVTDSRQAHPVAVATAVVTANVLMLVTLSTEIYTFWELRATGPRFGSNAELIWQMMLSATWGAYATALTAAGFKRRYAPIRYLAIAVFGVTVVKVFTVDLSQLDSIYRILSSIALGLLLMGASYLYQRHAAATTRAESAP
ncbi:MAG: DUF2339 domain-containing protein [bacterium]